MAGRPTDYTDELAAAICERLADGESLKAVCADDAMPARSSVYLWLATYQTFSDMYARAKGECADLLADEILEIADQYDQAKEKLEGGIDHIQRAKLRIDARKWVAAKLKPKVYGEKVHNEHSGPDGKPIQAQSVTEISDDELARIAATGSK